MTIETWYRDIKCTCCCEFLCRMMGVHGVKLMWRVMEESMWINVWWCVCLLGIYIMMWVGARVSVYVGCVRLTGCHKWTYTHFAWGTCRINKCEVNVCAVIMKCLLFSSFLWFPLVKGALGSVVWKIFVWKGHAVWNNWCCVPTPAFQTKTTTFQFSRSVSCLIYFSLPMIILKWNYSLLLFFR